MCEETINELKKEFKLPIEVCGQCLGDGEITTFCGHDVTEWCQKCEGKGYLRVLKMSKKSKKIRT
jgi:DnaJ-class molecular chaperone